MIAMRPSLRGDAAIDDEAGAGHEAGIVRGEKDDALGDIGHPCWAFSSTVPKLDTEHHTPILGV
jgi:hypothetical protein